MAMKHVKQPHNEARQFLDGAAAVLPADDWMLARARQTVDGAAVPASPVY